MRRLLAVIALLVAYVVFVRERLSNFGATDAESSSALPGDDLIPDADGVTTRAIEIAAPPSAVWPWLAQIGPAPRGGIYTFDWIENLFGLNMHSSDEILTEFQHPRPGERIKFGANEMEFVEIAPEHHFVMRVVDGNWVWAFVLIQDGDGTRMISRNSYRLPRLFDRIWIEPMIPASLVMEWRMLLGFKERAERLAREQTQGT